jgi:hypothetical protein
MTIAYLMILILWIAFFLNWWTTREQIEALRDELTELSARSSKPGSNVGDE